MPRTKVKKRSATPKKKVGKIQAVVTKLQKRYQFFTSASPHRSFRLTDQRDVPRAVKLPGFWSLTAEALRTICTHRMPLMKLVLITWLVSLAIVGVAQQSRYADVQDAIQVVGKEIMGGNVDGLLRVGTVFVSIASGGLNSTLSDAQQVYMALLYVLTWLTTVWLLRHLMAGKDVSVRDGLYSAGAPLVAVLLIVFVGLLQLLPGAVGIMVVSLAQQIGVLSSGVEVGVFWTAAALLCVLSLYWVTSTFFAIIIATIPGTYPTQALRSARHLVVGQRRQLLFRLLWLGLLLLVIYALVLLPAIGIDMYLQFSNLPFMTVVVQFITACLLVFASAYVYVLYRRILDERG